MFHPPKGFLLAAVHAMNVAAVRVELNEANSSFGVAQNNPFGVIYGLLVWIKSFISLVDKQRFFFASIVGSIYSILCSFPLSRLTFLWATWKGLTSRKLTTSGIRNVFALYSKDGVYYVPSRGLLRRGGGEYTSCCDCNQHVIAL